MLLEPGPNGVYRRFSEIVRRDGAGLVGAVRHARIYKTETETSDA